jgi:hypothetical protein
MYVIKNKINSTKKKETLYNYVELLFERNEEEKKLNNGNCK